MKVVNIFIWFGNAKYFECFANFDAN